MPAPAFTVRGEDDRIIISSGKAEIVISVEQVPAFVQQVMHALIGASKAGASMEALKALLEEPITPES